MQIILNKKDTHFEDPELSVRDLLDRMKFNFPLVFVKLNGKVIKKDTYPQAIIRDGDTVEAIHLMGGG